MNWIKLYFWDTLPSLLEICPPKKMIFEAVIIRDYRVLIALVISFVASLVLIVCDVHYWWSYEKKRRQIILLPAEPQQREQGCGSKLSSPALQEGSNEERLEELYVAPTPAPSTVSSARSRRRRPNRPFAVDHAGRSITAGVSSIIVNADEDSWLDQNRDF